MPVKQPTVRKSVSHFYNRGTARWTWRLVIMLTFIGVALSLPPVLAALTPGTVVVVDTRQNDEVVFVCLSAGEAT